MQAQTQMTAGFRKRLPFFAKVSTAVQNQQDNTNLYFSVQYIIEPVHDTSFANDLTFWQKKAFAFAFENSGTKFWQTQTQTAVCVCICVRLQMRLQKNSQMENPENKAKKACRSEMQ